MSLPDDLSCWLLKWLPIEGKCNACDLNLARECGGVTVTELAICAEVRSLQYEPPTIASFFHLLEARHLVALMFKEGGSWTEVSLDVLHSKPLVYRPAHQVEEKVDLGWEVFIGKIQVWIPIPAFVLHHAILVVYDIGWPNSLPGHWEWPNRLFAGSVEVMYLWSAVKRLAKVKCWRWCWLLQIQWSWTFVK